MNSAATGAENQVEVVPGICQCHNVSEPTLPLRCGWPKEPVDDGNDLDYLDFTAYPILLVLCTVGNALNVFVLRQERPQTSKNVYLLVMACLDLTYMWAESAFYIDAVVYAIPNFTRYTSGLMLFLQEAAAVSADWIIVAFSLNRFLAIQAPLYHRKFSSASRSLCISGVLILISCALASLRLFDYYWFLVNDLGPPHEPPRRTPVVQGLRMFYETTLPFIPFLTFLIILILNGLLMRVIILKRKRRKAKLRTSTRSSLSATSELKPSMAASEKNASLLLAACVLLYLVTQSPSVVLNMLEVLDSLCIRRFPMAVKQITDPIKLFFLKLNCSLNFVLYCAVSPVFRASLVKHLRRLFGEGRRASRLSNFFFNHSSRVDSTRSEELRGGRYMPVKYQGWPHSV